MGNVIIYGHADTRTDARHSRQIYARNRYVCTCERGQDVSIVVLVVSRWQHPAKGSEEKKRKDAAPQKNGL